MRRVRAVVVGWTVFTCALLVAPSARAQLTLSGLAGAVKDPAGNPVAGATVEAASPALIEQVRAVTTDGQGQFKITDLVPGTYSVTFKATGFSTVKQDGIELTAGFTGSANITLQLGGPNEVITVTGVVSVIDTQSSTVQRTAGQEALDKLASAQAGAVAAASITQGLANTLPDVGGSQGAYNATGGANQLSVRGKASLKRLFDGLRVENAVNNTSYLINQNSVEAQVLETAGGNAESLSSGGMINSVPKSGSNQLKVGFSGLYTREAWQSDNLDAALQARGLTSTNKVGVIWDYGAAIGGPVIKDKLWFFFAPKFWGNRLYAAGIYWNATQGTPFYTPDLSRRADQYEDERSNPVRMTWQATSKQKFNFFVDYPERACQCRRGETTTSPEATAGYHFRDGLVQTTWSSTRTSKLLLEAGWSYTFGSWPTFLQPNTSENDVAIIDIGKGFTYNANPSYTGRIGQDLAGAQPFPGSSYNLPGDGHLQDRMAERFSVAYVTGSHALKFGFSDEQVYANDYTWVNQNINYQFLNGVPNAIIQWTTPQLDVETAKADMGIYIQDQWTIKRLTLNYGLRYSYFNAAVPAQDIAPTEFVPHARNFAPVSCVPCWNDVDPRAGAAYDLFGNGRTAVKVSMGRYVGVQSVALALANNPLTTSVNSASRAWNDTSPLPLGSPGNFAPHCDLTNFAANGDCGPILNNNFGNANPNATRYDPNVINGWGKRDYIWDFSTEVNHAINRQITVNAGYYRNWSNNLTTTNNQAQSPSDFSPYCVTAPSDPRLPGGGGFPVCGLYDVSVAKRPLSQLVVTPASNYGTYTVHNNYVGGGLNARFQRGIRVGVNFETGRKETNQCFVVYDPAQTTYAVSTANAVTGHCDVVVPWLANMQVKANGNYPLPYGFSVNATYQNSAGAQDLALWAAPNAVIAPSLGRNLSAGANQTAVVPLITEGTQYEARRSQLDFRFSKTIKLTAKARFQANFDLYNVFNNNAVVSVNTTYNPPGTLNSNWLKPTTILAPRLFEIGGRLDF